MVVTFSGLDGAGKTTLLTELAQALESGGRSVTRFHWYVDVGLFGVIRRIRRKWVTVLSGNGSSARCPRVPKQRPVLHSRLVTALVLPIDLVVFQWQRWRALHSTEVLVIDRYFYDTLVDMSAVHTWWGRALLRVTPRPDMSVFVDVAPVVAFSRKCEFSVAELARRADVYRTLFHNLSHGTTISNEQLGQARQQLLEAVSGRFNDVMRRRQETLWR